MKLSKAIAQTIAKEMMKVIPFNINVMDEKAIIIGSGDKKRVGMYHEGAGQAIYSKEIFEVYEAYGDMKPGVNEPIIINGKIIGVIGITGNPDEVRPFSKLVSVTAQLLIEQGNAIERERHERLNRERFFHELSYRKTPYDIEFVQRAQQYKLNLWEKIRVILVIGRLKPKSSKAISEHYQHVYQLENNKTAIFMPDSKKLALLLEEVMGSDCKIAIGNAESLAAESLEQAIAAWKIGITLKPSSFTFHYSDWCFYVNLAKKEIETDRLAAMKKSNNSAELIQTLKVYIEENGDMNNISSKLNIHRNTLNYRLERIEKLTGKNPKNIMDLFELLYGLL